MSLHQFGMWGEWTTLIPFPLALQCMTTGRGSVWTVGISEHETFLAQNDLQMYTHAKNSKHSKMKMIVYAESTSPWSHTCTKEWHSAESTAIKAMANLTPALYVATCGLPRRFSPGTRFVRRGLRESPVRWAVSSVSSSFSSFQCPQLPETSLLASSSGSTSSSLPSIFGGDGLRWAAEEVTSDSLALSCWRDGHGDGTSVSSCTVSQRGHFPSSSHCAVCWQLLPFRFACPSIAKVSIRVWSQPQSSHDAWTKQRWQKLEPKWIRMYLYM